MANSSTLAHKSHQRPTNSPVLVSPTRMSIRVMSIIAVLITTKQQKLQYGQWGIQGHPAGFDGSMSEQAYSQVDPQLHPFRPLGVEGQHSRLFEPFSLDPDLLHQNDYAREYDYGTAQAEHHERRRRAKGKKEEAGEDRRKGKGKDKKQSPDQSQTSSSTSSGESHDEPAWADYYPMEPMEWTSRPHEPPIDVDTMIKKRFEFLRKSDASLRGQLGLPNRSKHDTLFRLFAKDCHFSRDWRPVHPRTQVEFERDRNIAKLLVEDARRLLERPDEPPEMIKLCQEVTTAFDKAKDKWGDHAAIKRRIQGLPSVEEQKRMEQILYKHPVKEQLESGEKIDAGPKGAGETFDFALIITKRRDKCLQGKRDAQHKRRHIENARRRSRRAARSHASAEE
ncbi:hypothetical protein FA10DRAFT_258714 [Acaromyces ingoldii]|uniref:Uncharacterized protein n=1 Tax=Acaromyces ingoldii TaxID=215250 RepID=A0A316YRL0_9BASI|nr:hypothetical protein FA10DRAFT_258714 [Acaromyces ingoldii]PWN91308.1 hypothetical protein FA10DRAFT_258714 [Acaromyces ingoldii]